MKARAPTPRGVALLVAMVLLSALSLGAASLLSQAQVLGMFTGGRRRQAQTDELGREGTVRGMAVLNSLLFASDAAPMDLSELRRLGRLGAHDPICIDGIDCSGWYQLPVPQGGSTAQLRVAATCNPDGCGSPAAQVVNFQIRAHVSAGGNVGQVTEIFVEP